MKSALFSGLLLLCAGAGPARGEDRVYASHLMVDHDVAVMSRISGIIDSVAVERGAVVSQGQPLALLDAREAEAEVREAHEEMQLRRAEYERAQSLASSKIVSAADLPR